MPPLLDVRDLHTEFRTGAGVVPAASANDPIEAHQRNDPAGPDLDRVVELLELSQIERGADDAGKRSVLATLTATPVLHWHGDNCDLPAGCEQLAATPPCPPGS